MHPELSPLFTQAGLRLTQPRIDVFTTLKDSHTPLTISQLIKLCPSADKVSVYRTIKLFSDMGIVVTVYNGWKQSYELASPFKPHHHHILCTQCGAVTEIKSDEIEALTGAIARNYGYLPTAHHFEITGVCKKCHKQNATSN